MNGRILLVEDNPHDVELTLRAFEKNNITNEVVIARDGVEALEFLYGAGEPPQLAVMLLDLKLPRLDGLDVLRRVREEPSTHLLPVVALTSSREESDVVRSYDLGVNSYIVKPVDFEKFVEAVRVIGMYWTLLNQRPPVSRG